MALITCPECGKEISDKSKKCIHCGYPLKMNTSLKKLAFVFVISAATLGALIAFWVFVISPIMLSKTTERCKVEGCTKAVYTKDYCIDHYADYRSGNSPASNSSTGTEDTEGFAPDNQSPTQFKKNEKQVSATAEFTLTGYLFDEKIEPDNTSTSYYHYYEASDGNTIIDVKFTIKSLAKSRVEQDHVLNSVKIIYDDTYEYNCTFVTVKSDNTFETYTSLYGIEPLETLKYHLIAEVPYEIKNDGKSLVCQVNADGSLYECRLR